MKDTEYAFAVASVRVRESSLLTKDDFSSLLAAKELSDCIRRLNEKGYQIEGADFLPALAQKQKDVWRFIREILPDEREFDSILIKNDFHNLKVSLKALVTESGADGLFLYPSKYDPEEIKEKVFSRSNDKLPEELRHADRSAYNILIKTGFAQLGDSVIDRAALEWSLAYAKKADHPVMLDLAEVTAAVSDIRVLWRCIRSEKETSFMNRAVCECSAFQKEALINAAGEGKDAFLDFLSHTAYADLGLALKETPGSFETLCDERIAAVLARGKSEVFGIPAIVAYYYAVNTEVKNLRILLSGRKNGLPDDKIRERMRRTYA